MSKTTQRIVVLIFALALIIPTALVRIGQLNGNDNSQVADSARETRKPADPASQPKPTNTRAPDPAKFTGMNEPTEAGAKASADHLFAVYAYMIATGDTSQWEQFSAPECDECLAFSTQAATLHKQGGWIVGGDITLSNHDITIGKVGNGDSTSEAGGQQPEKKKADGSKTKTTEDLIASDPSIAKQPSALITAKFHEADATLVEDPKLEAQTRKASDGNFTLTMRHDGKRWLVTAMTVS